MGVSVAGGVGWFVPQIVGSSVGGGLVATVDRYTCLGIVPYVLDLQPEENEGFGVHVTGYGQAFEELFEDSAPVVGYDYANPVQVSSLEEEQTIEFGLSASEVRWKFRITDAIARPFRYYWLRSRSHYYSYYIGGEPANLYACEHYYLSASDVATGWTYGDTTMYTESAPSIHGSYGDEDGWELLMLGGGMARLRSIGAVDDSEADFAIAADTWYILDYHAELDGTIAHLDLYLADGNALGEPVVSLTHLRDPGGIPTIDSLLIGANAVVFDTDWRPEFDWVRICVPPDGGGEMWQSSEGVGRFITEIPTHDLRDGETSLYLTSYPYVSGTLRVFYDGTRLRSGIDYVEIDPAGGSFRMTDAPGLSLYVNYERSGTVPTPGSETIYHPTVQLQYGWGTELDGWNALFACSAMALDRHTQGTYTRYAGEPRSTPPEHRSQQSEGGYGNLLGIATAWGDGWGQTLHSPGISSWTDFVSKIDEGRGAIIQGMYGALPINKRFADMDRQHALYINERLSNGDFWGYDPLQSFGIIYSAAELQSFAEALSFVSAGDVSAAYTQVTS